MENKTYCFDIDGVIATLVDNLDYTKASPKYEIIDAVNTLYDQGHTIILFTARGSVSGIDWEDVTKDQMEAWGVKYHQLLFGKPAADFYVDDKMISLVDLIKQVGR